jgi:hypothetical protein
VDGLIEDKKALMKEAMKHEKTINETTEENKKLKR